MHRITSQRASEAIAAGLELIPETIRRRLKDTHFLTQDPGFAGLHRWQPAIGDGRMYATVGHVAFGSFHLGVHPVERRITTVVLPTPENWEPWIVVHELGHVLHERCRLEPTLPAINTYAATNRWEAFAEAFRAWVMPEYSRYYEIDRRPEIAAFFASLS